MSMYRNRHSKKTRLVTIIAGTTVIVLSIFIVFILSPNALHRSSLNMVLTSTATMGTPEATVVLHIPEDVPVTRTIETSSPVQPLFTSTLTPSLIPQNTLNTLTATPSENVYKIQPGDNLINISIQFGVTVEELKAANHLTGDTIYTGETLIIPQNDGKAITVTPPLRLAPAPTIVVTEYPGVYLVQPGDTVETIADQYGMLSQTLRTINHMAGDAILPGQRLWISSTLELNPEIYRFTTFNEDWLDIAYPLSLEEDNFSLHYAPDTYPAVDPQAVAFLVKRSLTHLETLFGTPVNHFVDVYAAGSLFEAPSQLLRGRSYSAHWRTLFLQDGTGNAADQQYIITHELTHLYTWNVFGVPSSVMLSEGAAVYSGMMLIVDSDHIPIKTFCAAYFQAGELPPISSSLHFNGHIQNLPNYYAAGCFVGYLIETYGPVKFGLLYPTNNFDVIYEKTVWALEQEWRDTLINVPVPFKADDLVSAVNEVQTAYGNFLPAFSGTVVQQNAYYYLDLARLALLEGRFVDVTQYLQAFRQALK